MKGLIPRERVKIALSHREPDRLPIDLGEGRQTSIYPEPYLKAAEILGLKSLQTVTSSRGVMERLDEDFLKRLGVDFRRVALRDVPEDAAPGPGGTTRDVWGIGWTKSGHFWSPLEAPLKDATIDDLQRYPWPDPADERRFKGLREEAEFKSKNTPYAIVAKMPNHVYGVLTQSIYLRGMENFFVDLILNKQFASALMERVLQYHLGLYERYLDEVGAFIDIFHTADDLGTQDAPYFSLDLYREMIEPMQRRLLGLVKDKTEAEVLYHCDGDITHFLDDLIGMGVDILNPVQPLPKMQPSMLKKRFGDRLSFHGGVDQQRVLTRGTAEEVSSEVMRRVAELGAGGGYILAAAQTIMPEVPGENVVQMFSAARKYGVYPL